MAPTLVQNIIKNDATNCSETCLEIYEKTCVSESAKHANVAVKTMCLRVSPIGCRTMEINKNTPTNT